MPRVSTRRQGVIATKVRALVDIAVTIGRISGPVLTAVSLSAWLGCQYRGAAQFFSGTKFSCVVCPVNRIGTKSRGRKTGRETARPEYFECRLRLLMMILLRYV
jgi:hypothetical protein